MQHNRLWAFSYHRISRSHFSSQAESCMSACVQIEYNVVTCLWMNERKCHKERRASDHLLFESRKILFKTLTDNLGKIYPWLWIVIIIYQQISRAGKDCKWQKDNNKRHGDHTLTGKHKFARASKVTKIPRLTDRILFTVRSIVLISDSQTQSGFSMSRDHKNKKWPNKKKHTNCSDKHDNKTHVGKQNYLTWRFVCFDIHLRKCIRTVKLNNFVFQHAFYCHVCHCSLCAISYLAMMAKEKEFL